MNQITSRYQRAYDALVSAYFNNTLSAGVCDCCAVGNICLAAGMPSADEGEDSEKFTSMSWSNLFYTCDGIQVDRIDEDEITKELARELFVRTGYTAEELMEIEYAFETNTKHKHKFLPEQMLLEDQYNGLVAVLEVLQRLDNVPAEKENRFKSHPKLVLA